MTKLNLKQISSVLHYFNKIKQDEFDEYTIKSLLIDIRDSLPMDSVLREICHFVAHPLERDRGITHSKIDRYYCQFKYVNLLNAKVYEFPVNQMTKKEFDVFCDIILNTNEDFFFHESAMTPTDAINSLNGCYKNKDGKRVLHKPKAIKQINTILNTAMRSIEANAIITQDDIIGELTNQLISLSHEHIPAAEIINHLGSHADELILCIISLLQSASFKLYDGKVGVGILLDSDDGSLNVFGQFPVDHFPNIDFASAPLISSNVPYAKYFGKSHVDKLTFEVVRNTEGELKINQLNPS